MLAPNKLNLLVTVGTLAALMGTRAARAAEPPLIFGNVPIGQFVDVQTSVSNTGDPRCSLIFDGIRIVGQAASDFQIIQNNALGRIIGVNDHSGTYVIRFTPSVTGQRFAQVTTDYHAPNPKCHRWPREFRQLSGVGVPPVSSSQSPPKRPSKRAFFFLAYVAKDDEYNPGHLQSFPWAARTWENEIKEERGFIEGQDLFLERYVHTPLDFVNAWGEIAAITRSGDFVVEQGAIFSHSSEPGLSRSHGVVEESGLEFAFEPGITKPLPASSTLTRTLIDSLVKMNWDSHGEIFLFGCNTGVMRAGDPSFILSERWSPASEFADVQRVMAQGEDGFASFSKEKDRYVKVQDESTPMYLEAFWKINAYGVVVGPGTRRMPITVKPLQP